MREPASNRQKKLLRFFGVKFSPSISLGAAGWEIEALFSDPDNRDLWSKYLYKTNDLDSTSEFVVPVDRMQLQSVIVPTDWNASRAIYEFRADLAGKIFQDESPYDIPEPQIAFQSAVFMFTGKFSYGSRDQCQTTTTSKGGICPKQKSVSQNIDFW